MKNPTSSSQPLLVVGSYAAAVEPGIHAFRFDLETGALTAAGSFAGIARPSFLVVHPNKRWLYAVSETGQKDDGVSGSVWALRFERDLATIQSVNNQLSGGDWPCHLQFDSTGRWLFVSNYGTGSAGVLPILPDGALGEMADLVQHHGHSVNPERQEGPHAHSATTTPDGRFVIVADLGTDELAVYRFDSSAGKLNEHARVKTRPGAGPRHLAFHPDGRRVYVANELDSTVTAYDYDAARGTLRETQTLDTLPAGAPENTVADIHISPSAQRLYVSNRGHDSIAVYEVEADGRLARVAVPSCGGKWPRNFALAPGGSFLLVANQYSDEVSVLPALAGAAELGAASSRVAVPQPACVQFA